MNSADMFRLKKCVFGFRWWLALLFATTSLGAADGPTVQRLTLQQFQSCLQELKTNRFREKVSPEELYRLKRSAADTSLPHDSWPAILQLWVVGEADLVQLLWWQKDDTETRAFIVSLEWCMVGVPAKGAETWPKGMHDFDGMAARFDTAERKLRTRENDFVREHYSLIARELALILSASKIKLAKNYEGFAELNARKSNRAIRQRDSSPRPELTLSITQAVENIVLIEDLTPKRGEPQTDSYAAAIISLGTKAGPLLAEKLLDDRDSKWAYCFQYKIADLADALLSDIYHQYPSEALVRRNKPMEPTQGYCYWDYAALTSSRKGREELRAAWKKIIEEAERNSTSEVRTNVSALPTSVGHDQLGK